MNENTPKQLGAADAAKIAGGESYSVADIQVGISQLKELYDALVDAASTLIERAAGGPGTTP
jgi:hypothetical protein